MISNGGGVFSFQFDPTSDSFKYLRTNTIYDNNPVDINSLIAAANTATPILGSSNYYYADFNVGTSDNYLYLIWDFRNSEPVNLCYSETESGLSTICCDCDPCSDPCKSWSFANVGEGTASVSYTNCSGTPIIVNIEEQESVLACAMSKSIPQVLSGNVLITVVQECGCPD